MAFRTFTMLSDHYRYFVPKYFQKKLRLIKKSLSFSCPSSLRQLMIYFLLHGVYILHGVYEYSGYFISRKSYNMWLFNLASCTNIMIPRYTVLQKVLGLCCFLCLISVHTMDLLSLTLFCISLPIFFSFIVSIILMCLGFSAFCHAHLGLVLLAVPICTPSFCF